MKIQNHKAIIDPNMSYETPDWLFRKLDSTFHFTVDAASSDENAKCVKHWTKEDDGLSKDWSNEIVWVNPPYDRSIGNWVKKAYLSSLQGATVVMLMPVKTDTSYFHKYIIRKAKIVFLRGRLKFSNSSSPAIFPSMIVIWRPVNNDAAN